jgi:hypothetical protein
MLRSKIENYTLYRADDLCQFAEELGYKETGKYACNQLQCSNGSYVSSLLNFLNDNPGVMEAIRDWTLENQDLDEDEDSSDEDTEE